MFKILHSECLDKQLSNKEIVMFIMCIKIVSVIVEEQCSVQCLRNILKHNII